MEDPTIMYNEKSNSSISGDLYLINEGREIQVKLKVIVSNENYEHGKHSYTIQNLVALNRSERGLTDGPIEVLRGIVFNYFDTENPNKCDILEQEQIEKNFNFILPNDKAWIVGDDVKIMMLNESLEKDFTDRKPYFEKYLKTFGHKSVSDLALKAFNIEWNENNKDLEVNDLCSLIESQKDSKILSIDKSYDYKPHYTRDGGVLSVMSLKLK